MKNLFWSCYVVITRICSLSRNVINFFSTAPINFASHWFRYISWFYSEINHKLFIESSLLIDIQVSSDLKPLVKNISNLKLKCITSIYYLNMSYIFWYSEEIKLQWPRKPPAGKTLILMAASSPLLKIISFDPSIWKTRFYKQLLVSYTLYHM